MRKFQSLMASTAIIAGLAAVSPASAGSLSSIPTAGSTTYGMGAGTPSTGTPSTSDPVNTYDPTTETTTTTTTTTQSVTNNYLEVLPFTFIGSVQGNEFSAPNLVAAGGSITASESYTQSYTTTATSTPDGLGGFTLTGPDSTAYAPVTPSDAVISNVTVGAAASTEFTAMYSGNVNTTSTSGATATLVYDQGYVGTDGTHYETGTGTATFDPATGEVTVALTAGNVTELTAAGLNTTGTVNAANVNVTSSLNLNGNTISNVGTGVLATDAANTGQVTAEAAARAAADVTLQSNIDGVDAELHVEEAARIAADATLQSNITAEATARAAAVTAEATTRAAADTTLTNNLAAEVSARTAAVSAEATTRAAADTVLTNGLAAEVSARTAAVSAEAATRAAADTAEATTRAAADTVLTNNLAAEVSARTAAVASEASARAAADNALGVRIDSEAAARVAGDAQLRNEIASSTAAAIALGGNAILPDKSFTLSGNVGFYQGASAIAVNAAARISPNVYVTGAVGGGLNKSGKLGGRVGVVFGF